MRRSTAHARGFIASSAHSREKKSLPLYAVFAGDRTLPAQSSRQHRFAPTTVHLRSGRPFGFPPESMFTFTGIPSILSS